MENLQGGTLALEHRYHLDARIGAFGMVTLYAGTQDPFGLPVVVSVYGGLLEAGADDAVAARIKESATRASAIEAEGLLSVVDFGEIEKGVPFVIEETVDGPTLDDKLADRAVLPPDEVGKLIRRLAKLLQAAHDEQLFHGNLKPHWIHFPDASADAETARLSHFGLSPAMGELVEMPQAVLTTDLVDAFPPECFDVAARDQAQKTSAKDRSPHLSAAADQWGLAALAYRLLVGVHPYFDDPVDASEGILRIKTEAPPSLADMGVDQALADVIDRALAPDPDSRWPSIEAFADAAAIALGHSLDQSPQDAQAPAPVLDEGKATPATDEPPPEVVGPRPSGYLLTFALVALVLTNLGWSFWFLNDQVPVSEEEVDEQVSAPSPETLPAGLQIKTIPAEAELFLIDDGVEESLGFTPHVVTQALFEQAGVEFLLRRDGYHPQRLAIEDTEAGQNIALQLVTQDEPEGTDSP